MIIYNTLFRLCLIVFCAIGSSLAADFQADTLLPSAKGIFNWRVNDSKGSKLTEIRTSCGCTVADKVELGGPIPPEGVVVKMRYGNIQRGIHRVSLKAFTNGVVIQEDCLIFTISDPVGIIKNPVDGELFANPWSKLELAFNDASQRYEAHRTFVKNEIGSAPWENMDVKSSSILPPWEVSLANHGDGQYRLDVFLNARNICGLWTLKIPIEFHNGEEKPIFIESIVAKSVISGPVSAIPSELIVGSLQNKETQKLRFKLEAKTNYTVSLLSVECDESGQAKLITPDVKKVESHLAAMADAINSWTVEVEFTGKEDVLGKANGALIATFSDGVKVRIPYLATIVPSLSK